MARIKIKVMEEVAAQDAMVVGIMQDTGVSIPCRLRADLEAKHRHIMISATVIFTSKTLEVRFNCTQPLIARIRTILSAIVTKERAICMPHNRVARSDNWSSCQSQVVG